MRAQEVFNGQDVVIVHDHPTDDTAHKRAVHLAVDETKIIYTEPTSSRPEYYFYLPPEAASVAQLIVQTRDGQRTFMLKGIGRGKTVGGFVLREWLDDSGFNPNSPLDESHIQSAVKAKPVYVIVQ